MKTECVQRRLGTLADDTVAKVSVTRFRFIRLPPNWWKPGCSRRARRVGKTLNKKLRNGCGRARAKSVVVAGCQERGEERDQTFSHHPSPLWSPFRIPTVRASSFVTWNINPN